MFDDMVKIMTDAGGNEKADILTARRTKLLELIAQEYPEKAGSVFLFAPFEGDHEVFLQDSNFYYFSGINEPACVLSFDVHNGSCLHVPDFGDFRAKWVHSIHDISEQTIASFGIDRLQTLGNRIAGYSVEPYFAPEDYKKIIEQLREIVAKKHTIFTLYPTHGKLSASVKMIVDRLSLFVPGLHASIVDISSLVAILRRKKDISEIEDLYQAIEITNAAFQAASHVIKPGAKEAEIQAAMEYIFIENGARKAYPAIIAGGQRATILHYNTNQSILEKGQLVLIDAGAMYNHYCADITRVFPVSGKFDKQQRMLYEIVLETQQHVAEHVRPGVWISNPQEQEASLQHIALNFLKKSGYDQYFMHGIGHYLGLDVHDVGSRSQPLQEGDVITIEPGIYIPDKSIGIRIEDNYWVVKDSEPVCLSEDIPKTIGEIEEMVQQSFER
ncbi:MAG TPA: aminopeptidase P N-terminal domain-containing protein [Candidatus Saccharimonadales bacterium]|nr:aminopeptidase P N-terminal domain-containing protein [Candidatus Saccharimonadales bacterium]